MLVYRCFKIPKRFHNSVLAIGNFDGVHLGHKSVIMEAKKIAREEKKNFGVLTFEPHPKCFFKKKFNFFRLTPFRTKFEILRSIGIDFLLNIKFDDSFVKISAENFLQKYLVESLDLSHVVIGFDFVFGHKQSGNVQLIKNFAQISKSFTCSIVPELKIENVEVSSSNIRNLLRQGNVIKANKLLSRKWTIESRVVEGKKKGREIGFKTANLRIKEYCDLCFGVYFVEVKIRDHKFQKKFLGIANYGIKPTFKNDEPLLEVHIFNFNAEIYGKRVSIIFKKFIRYEKKFASIEKLREQIIKDINSVKNE